MNWRNEFDRLVMDLQAVRQDSRDKENDILNSMSAIIDDLHSQNAELVAALETVLAQSYLNDNVIERLATTTIDCAALRKVRAALARAKGEQAVLFTPGAGPGFDLNDPRR